MSRGCESDELPSPTSALRREAEQNDSSHGQQRMSKCMGCTGRNTPHHVGMMSSYGLGQRNSRGSSDWLFNSIIRHELMEDQPGDTPRIMHRCAIPLDIEGCEISSMRQLYHSCRHGHLGLPSSRGIVLLAKIHNTSRLP